MSSNNHEESGYYLDLDLLTISYCSGVAYSRRSGLVGKSNHLTPIYLTSKYHSISFVQHLQLYLKVQCFHYILYPFLQFLFDS